MGAPRGRNTVTFAVKHERVERSPEGELARRVRWLKADGTLGDAAEEAVKFTFWRSPTPAERHRIEVATHEVAGGLRAWVDLEQGIEATQKVFIGALEEELWPEGRPEAEGPEFLTQQDQLAKAWDAAEGELRQGLQIMLQLRDRLRFMASWPVLIRDAPEGWSNIAERDDLDEDLFRSVWLASSAATAAALLEQPRSSAP